MKDIKLTSRYPNVETIYHPINSFSGTIFSNGNYARVGLDQDNPKEIAYVDFEGGPMLYKGANFATTGKKIKSIKACYYVELEE